MKLTTTTDNKKLSVEEIFEATEYFAKLLIPKKKRKKLKINISFSSDDATPGWQASCLQVKKNEYRVWIRKSSSVRNQLLSLAHEMVHVKQFALKELCPKTLNVKSAALKKLSIVSNDEYWDQPYEIEAHGRAEGLVYRYIQQRDK